MHQGQAAHGRSSGRERTRRRRGPVLLLASLAALLSIGAGAAAPRTPASAAPWRQPVASPPGTTTTTVVSPTTTVTTTTGIRSVTTATTTVTAGAGSVTSSTVTTVAPTIGGPTTTTTVTTVPTAAPATTAPTVLPAVRPAVVAPRPPTFDSTCTRPATPGLQAYLDSLPARSTFRSSTTACYLVPTGILLTKPITIIGGTFFDPTDTRGPGLVYNALKPIIFVKNTSRVTVSGVSVLGINTGGDYHPMLVGQAGFKVMSSTDVTLTDDTARNTFGDGLELVADYTDHIALPVTGLTVRGFTTVNAGRQGVTVAEAASSVLDHVTVISPADAGFDFESDIAGAGSSNVTISNCNDDRGFNLIEFFSGPITISNCVGFHHVTLGSLHSNAPINFVGGHLSCKRNDPVPCIDQTGGSLTFTNVTIDRMPGVDEIDQAAWAVKGGGTLTFTHSPVAAPIGWAWPGSTVTFIP